MNSNLMIFFDQLKYAKNPVLMLDYDGTLAPFCTDRSKAIPYKGVREAIKIILKLQNSRVIIISGRSVKDVQPLLDVPPTLEIWGSHGWEYLSSDGLYYIKPISDQARYGLKKALQEIQGLNILDYCEQKPVGLAIHWRGLSVDKSADIRERVIERWEPMLQDNSLEIHPFDGGIELRAVGQNKGFPVRSILSELGEESVAAYLGDDLTDEDAFNAILGHGIGILVRKEYRKTAATIWLKPPEELIEFFNAWISSRDQHSSFSKGD